MSRRQLYEWKVYGYRSGGRSKEIYNCVKENIVIKGVCSELTNEREEWYKIKLVFEKDKKITVIIYKLLSQIQNTSTVSNCVQQFSLI